MSTERDETPEPEKELDAELAAAGLVEVEATPEPGGPAPATKRKREPVDMRPRGAKSHLSPVQWLEIVGMVKEGVSVARVCKIFKVKPSTVYRGLKRRGVRIGAYVAAATEQVENETRKQLIAKIRETKEEDYRRTEILQRLIVSKVVSTQRDNVPIATIQDDIKTLQMAINAIRAGTENKWRILGLDKFDENETQDLPELPVRELTEAEVAAIRDSQTLEDLSDEELARMEAEEALEEGDDEDVVAEGEDEDEDEDWGGGNDA